MNILINCSNLKKGGGLQVADSVCTCLNAIPQHNFFLVLSSCMDDTADRVSEYKNVTVVRHDIRNSWYTLFWGRDKAMDNLVTRHNIGGVLTNDRKGEKSLFILLLQTWCDCFLD